MEAKSQEVYFCKEYFHSLDEKGRLMLPLPHRKILEKVNTPPELLRLSYMPGTKFLNLYPSETWEIIMGQWRDEARFNSTKEFMENMRLFMSKIDEVTVDKTGRILLPAGYREFIGLEKEAVVVGVNDKIEIWEAETYKAYELEAVQRRLEREAADAASPVSQGKGLPRW
jgi:MraZ protein